MSPIGHLVLLGWIPAVLAMFAMMRPRTAVLTAFIAAWLLLPVYGYSLSGLPDYTKMSATVAGAMLGVLLYDQGRLLRFRPSWIDLPVAVWCVAPFFSSVANGIGPIMGAYDGASESLGHVITWGLPWFLGRLYLGSLAGQVAIVKALIIGAVVYIPFCLWEVRMSPQLHRIIYGFHQQPFHTTMRLGGFRPVVFMDHGLQVGVWLGAAALVGIWSWHTGLLRRLRFSALGMKLDGRWLVAAIIPTFILAKSLGAFVLVAGGIAAMLTAKWFRTALPVLAIAGCIALYIPLRATGAWDGMVLVEGASVLSESRAGSLEFRIKNENELADRAMQRPVFGWGGWGRAFVRNRSGDRATVTDGLWIIALGENGLVGIAGLYGALLIPPCLLIVKSRPKRWGSRSGRAALLAAPVSVCVVVLLYAADTLPNGLVNPVFFCFSGGLAGLAVRGIRIPSRSLAGRRRPAASARPGLPPEPSRAPARRRRGSPWAVPPTAVRT